MKIDRDTFNKLLIKQNYTTYTYGVYTITQQNYGWYISKDGEALSKEKSLKDSMITIDGWNSGEFNVN